MRTAILAGAAVLLCGCQTVRYPTAAAQAIKTQNIQVEQQNSRAQHMLDALHTDVVTLAAALEKRYPATIHKYQQAGKTQWIVVTCGFNDGVWHVADEYYDAEMTRNRYFIEWAERISLQDNKPVNPHAEAIE